MVLLGFLIALFLFFFFKRRLQRSRQRCDVGQCSVPRSPGAASWREEWHRQWADKFHQQAERRIRYIERTTEQRLRRLDRRMRRFGVHIFAQSGAPGTPKADGGPLQAEIDLLKRARRRAAAEFSFYWHLMSYLGVIAFLALVNLMTTTYPWFIWPAIGWGIGLFFHYMAVFGSRMLRERYFEPAVEREVRREKAVMQTEKQASIGELSATIAHEIRNPKSDCRSEKLGAADGGGSDLGGKRRIYEGRA